MNWQIFIAMIVAIPIILLPVAVLWYLNIGGIFNNVKAKMDNRDKKKAG
jgi:hypothetical protein